MADHFREIHRRAVATRASRCARTAAPSDGAEAQRQGFPLDANPFAHTDPEWQLWRTAWREAWAEAG